MARIPQDKVDEILNAADIIEIISDYVQLKKKGQNWWALSPFSSEKSPSFAVNPNKGIFKDFSSGKGGNAISFLMEVEGYTYVEALRHVAHKYNIEIAEAEDDPEALKKTDHNQSLYIVNEFAAKYFHEQLTTTDSGKRIALSYFKERGLLDATIQSFQLGYAQDEWEAFAQAALKNQYKEEYLLELGLVSRSEKTGKLIDRFKGRVIFPISNGSGKILGFGGRIMSAQTDTAKYINSPESPVYHKSQVLYGLYQAKKYLRDENLCILTEGYMDVLLLHQNGIRNAVASSGTALTPEQVRIIRRFTKRVLMIYDGDKAGIKAALRAIDLFLQEGIFVRILVLPDNHDPDSYVRLVGPQAFKDFMETDARSFVDFKLSILRPGPLEPQQEAEVVRSMAESLAHVSDLVERQLYARQVAQKLGIPENLLLHAIEDALKGVAQEALQAQRRENFLQEKQQAEVKELRSFEKLPLSGQEKELLRILFNHFDKNIPWGTGEDSSEIPLVAIFQAELEGLSFDNPLYEGLKQDIFHHYNTGEQLNLNVWLTHDDAAVRSTISELLTLSYEISPNWSKFDATVTEFDQDFEKSAKDALYHYQFKKVKKLIAEVQQQLAELDPNNTEEEDHLTEVYLHLLEQRKIITRRLGAEGAILAEDPT